MSTERIIVHSSIAGKFQEKLQNHVDRLYGTAENLPVIITAASARRNRALIEDAVSHGATILNDETVSSKDTKLEPETKMRPTILANIGKEMKLYATFGIPLIHGWLPAPHEEAFRAFNRSAQSFDAAQTLPFAEPELEHKLNTEGYLI